MTHEALTNDLSEKVLSQDEFELMGLLVEEALISR